MAVRRNVFLLLLGLANLLSGIHAKEYVVGGELEWTFPPAAQSTWYSDVWAKPINFEVGDVLVFTYARLHNVCELGNETDFLACAPGNPIAVWNSGSTRVTLSKAGAYYFICGSIGHCELGMKLKVNVESAVSSRGPAASPASSVPTPTLPPAPTPAVFTPTPVTPAPTTGRAPTSTATSAPTNSESTETPPRVSSSSPPAAAHQSVTTITLFLSLPLLYSFISAALNMQQLRF